MSQQLETTFHQRLRDWFNASGGYARKLHGNVYQSGIPDLFLCSKFGVSFMCELKIWRKVNHPTTVSQFISLTGKQQRAFIMQMWELKAYCPMLAMHESGQIIYYCDGTNVSAHLPQQIVSYLLNLKPEDFHNAI